MFVMVWRMGLPEVIKGVVIVGWCRWWCLQGGKQIERRICKHLNLQRCNTDTTTTSTLFTIDLLSPWTSKLMCGAAKMNKLNSSTNYYIVDLLWTYMIDDLYMMLKLESSCMTPWDRSPPLVNSMWIRRIEPCILPHVIRTWSLELCLLLLLLLVVNLFLSQCCFCPGCSWGWKTFFLQRK